MRLSTHWKATALSALLLSSGLASAGEKSQHLALDTLEQTTAQGVAANVLEYKDKTAIHLQVKADHKSIEEGGCDNCTFLRLDNTAFKNGAIEIDLAGKPTENAPAWARGFVGIIFGVNEDNSRYEGFYLRPMNAIETGERRNFTVQYFAYPDYPWNILREQFPGQYEGWADVKPGEWQRLRVELEPESARFLINGDPVLTVEKRLGGTAATGAIGLFTEPATDAYFSDLTLRPAH